MANDLLQIDYMERARRGAEASRERRFADLASQAYATQDQPARNALLTQAIAANPQAGRVLRQEFREEDDSDLRKAVGAARYVKQAYDSKNPQQLQGAYQAVRPFLTKLGASQGRVPPEQWSDDMLPQLHQLIAMGDGVLNKGGLPTGFREFDMTAQAAGLTPGTPGYQEAAQIALGTRGRAATGGFGFDEVIGADGRKRLRRTNPRTGVVEIYDEATGDFAPLGGGGSLNSGTGSAPAMSQSPAQAGGNASVSIDGLPQEQQQRMANMVSMMQKSGFPDDQIDSWVSSQLSMPRQATPAQFTSEAPRAPANPALGVGRTPEEQAALTTAAQEQAKINAEINAYRQMTGLEVDRAAAVEEAKANAKTQADVAAQQGTRARDASQVLTLLAEAEKLIPKATGSSGGALVDRIAGSTGTATEGAKATASLRTIAGQLTAKMPRMEGPQSNADVEMYKQMAGDLANPNTPREVRLAALNTIRQLNQKYAAQNAPASRPPAAGNRGGVDDLLNKYGIR